ncbi:MAG: isochorismate synthase [Gemmatimonadota bacterium]
MGAAESRAEAEARLDGVDPAAVLRAGDGRPRGLWSDARGWCAWFGEATVLTASGEGRFGQIRAAAEHAAGRGGGRFFGGFAFHDAGDEVTRWVGFPAARFVLPAVEARGDADGVRLRVRAQGNGDARALLEEVAASVRAQTAPPSSGSGADLPEDGLREPHGGWNATVRAALEEIGSGRLEKVVLARAMDVPVMADPVGVTVGLRSDEPDARVFLFEPIPGRAFLGAAPESLADVRDGALRTTAVAGSARRGFTPAEDRALAEALLGSAKDRAEQALVVRDIAARLAPLVRDLDVERGRHLIRFARIQHLETVLRGRLEADVDALGILEALHPTPAVGGAPRGEALDFIRRTEGFRRGWYAGPVGWFEPGGDASFAPALRSALYSREVGWRLFAGAGIVHGSEPEKEWAETAVKLEPVLAALRRACG